MACIGEIGLGCGLSLSSVCWSKCVKVRIEKTAEKIIIGKNCMLRERDES